MSESTAHDGITGKRSLRDRLMDMALDRFTLGRSADERAFIVEHNGPNVALLPGIAKRRLAAVARADLGTTPGRAPLDEAWTALEGLATEQPKTHLPLRVADHNGKAVLDLGDTTGRAVLVTARGWQVVDRSPVTFRRSKAALPLPTPSRGGDLTPLWEVVNVPPKHRDIVRAWLACALFRNLPHPIVSIRGEQGSAKSTATHYLGAMIDPCAVGTLSPPAGADKWAASALARWVIPVDNVSKIDQWWSDALCRTVTGAGTLDRALYTDDDAVAKPLHGAVILNGISLASALRSDLAERLLPLELVRPVAYRTEGQVTAHFAAHHGAMLGAVLDDAAAILAHRDRVTVPGDLRMADFARDLAAFDAATGANALATYRTMHDEAAAEALDSDAIARTVLELLQPGDTFDGTASALLARLSSIRNSMVAEHELDGSSNAYWPSDGTRLSMTLARSGPILAANGVTYSKGRSGGRRTVRLSRAAEHKATGGGTANGDAGDADSPCVAPRGKESNGKEHNSGSVCVTQRHSVTAATPSDLLSVCDLHAVTFVTRCPRCTDAEVVGR